MFNLKGLAINTQRIQVPQDAFALTLQSYFFYFSSENKEKRLNMIFFFFRVLGHGTLIILFNLKIVSEQRYPERSLS
jgi:hypothetical protein